MYALLPVMPRLTGNVKVYCIFFITVNSYFCHKKVRDTIRSRANAIFRVSKAQVKAARKFTPDWKTFFTPDPTALCP
jgi:hypothetical protein